MWQLAVLKAACNSSDCFFPHRRHVQTQNELCELTAWSTTTASVKYSFPDSWSISQSLICHGANVVINITKCHYGNNIYALCIKASNSKTTWKSLFACVCCPDSALILKHWGFDYLFLFFSYFLHIFSFDLAMSRLNFGLWQGVKDS